MQCSCGGVAKTYSVKDGIAAKCSACGRRELVVKNPEKRTVSARLYAVPNRGSRATHVIEDGDTLCTMLSTGGLQRIDKYDLVSSAESHSNHRRFCAMCASRM